MLGLRASFSLASLVVLSYKVTTEINNLFDTQEWAAKYWVSKGCPKNKLVIGMATYGRSFRLSSASNNGVGASASGSPTAGTYTRESGMYAYYEVSVPLSVKRNTNMCHLQGMIRNTRVQSPHPCARAGSH